MFKIPNFVHINLINETLSISNCSVLGLVFAVPLFSDVKEEQLHRIFTVCVLSFVK